MIFLSNTFTQDETKWNKTNRKHYYLTIETKALLVKIATMKRKTNLMVQELDSYQLREDIQMKQNQTLFLQRRWRQCNNQKGVFWLNEEWKLNIKIDDLQDYPNFKKEKSKSKRTAIDILNEKQKKAILACNMQNMSIMDIADALNVKPDVIESFLQNHKTE